MNDTIYNCKSLIIGHRGAKADVMENTLESILYSINAGVDGIEFDVQTCLNGDLVLFHDETLNRLGFRDDFYFEKTQNKPINKLRWYDLYNTELIDSLGRKYKIPKLVEVLRHPTVYTSDTLINIDIKDTISHEGICNLIMELIDEGLYEPDRFLLSSVHLDSLIYINEFKEELETKDSKYQKLKIGWILSEENIPADGLLNSVKYYSKVLTHIVIDKDILNLDVIDQCRRLNLSTFVYTINDRSEYPIDRLDTIVEGIITDKPKIFL